MFEWNVSSGSYEIVSMSFLWLAPFATGAIAVFFGSPRRPPFAGMGVPRPLQAVMEGAGVGAVRTSQWQKGVHFREIVTQWQPPNRLSYDFDIPPGSIPRAAFDRHVEIGGKYFTVVSGGFTIRPLGAGRCEVTLRTTYANRSSLKIYGDLWGDFVFDDFHRSVLRLIKHRAEG